MIDPQVAWDKLSCFETAEEIREYFREEGIQATRMTHNRCAIAKWLKEVTNLEEVSVAGQIHMGGYVTKLRTLGGINITKTEPKWSFEHTDATVDFINKFDEGAYPELVDPANPVNKEYSS